MDEDGSVEAAPVRRLLGIAEMEGDAVLPRGLEKRRGLVGGQRRLVPVVGIGDVLLVPARKEGGQRQFGEDDHLGAVPVRALHEPDHAANRDVAALRLLDGAELGAGHRDESL